MKSRVPFRFTRRPQSQAGLTLVELMVGLALGMLVTLIAITALMSSRGISVTTSESTKIQQQAGYAFRVIGQQLRQAGSIELSLGDITSANVNSAFSPVTFDPGNLFNRASFTIKDTGSATAPELSVGFQNVLERIYKDNRQNPSDTVLGYIAVNCLADVPGGKSANTPANTRANPNVVSIFSINSKKELVCGTPGSSGAQPIVKNVTGFTVNYMVQSYGGGQFNMQRVPASGVADWGKVYAVEVCLDLHGDEIMKVYDPSLTYIDCNDNAVSFNQRMHLVTRHTFLLRSQGAL